MGLTFDDNLNVSPADVADIETINNLIQSTHPDAPPIPARANRPRVRKPVQPPVDQGERITTTQPHPREPQEGGAAAPPTKHKPPCSARTTTAPSNPPRPQPPRRAPWWYVLPVFTGMLAMLALWVIGSAVITWGSGQLEQYQYGAARISQYDFDLGHGRGTSHLLAEYYRGEVVVIEFSPLDPPKGHVSAVMLDPGDQTPRLVSLHVQDVNHDGKPDIIAIVEGRTITPVFYNNGTSLQTIPPHEGGQA
jgi:hypothetical protein